MKSIQLNNNFKAILPDEWNIETEGNVISLYNALGGCGALQFTSYLVPNISDIDPVEELFWCIADKHQDLEVKSNNNCSFANITDYNGIYWRYWLFKNSKAVLLVTYNCDVTDKDEESTVIEIIIRSVNG